MSKLLSFFASRRESVSGGIFIGILAALLQKMGNPGNMGICAACFERDIAGSLGLQRAAVVQYMRPEIIGFVLGALLAAYLFRESRARAGSAPWFFWAVPGGPCLNEIISGISNRSLGSKQHPKLEYRKGKDVSRGKGEKIWKRGLIAVGWRVPNPC